MSISKFPTQLDSLPEYELILIPIENLITDGAYQRPVQPSHVRKIADNFELLKFRPLTGNLRPDGTVALVDGLQRATALQMLGYEGLVPVIIPTRPMTLKEEAIAFLAMNMDNKAVRAVDSFQAQITSGNSHAVQINEVLGPLGLVVDSSRKDMTISAAGSLRLVINECGGINGPGKQILHDTLNGVVAAYGGEFASLSSNMVRGVAAFLFNLNEKYFDVDVLVSLLETKSPSDWLASAQGNQKIHLAFAKVLLESYFETYSDLYMLPSSIEDMEK